MLKLENNALLELMFLPLCPCCGQAVSSDDKSCGKCSSALDVGRDTLGAIAKEDRTPRSVFTVKDYIIEEMMTLVRGAVRISDKEGNLLGHVKKEINRPTLWFETPDGNRIGEMRPKSLVFEIYDAEGLLEGVAKLKTDGKMMQPHWFLADSSGRTVAEATDNLAAQDFTIKSPSGMEVARIHKKGGATPNSYRVEIFNGVVNPYLIVAFAIAMNRLKH